ncbi:hypothetical protein Rrhod_1375 [Rhodococcus rhodnii LMG 5362]|uniref:Uncharacterized protein n=1 Tax=Rhodococcus rhodnii LMG 5362 TaxID=1273125 RepID=R7WPN7_9NOCA|nr:hypothetical protein Rrhod_1375 [Rhodococcus rhodnii LMG 5362]
MLAGHRSPELDTELRGTADELRHRVAALGCPLIEVDPDVHAPGTEVAVEDSGEPELVEQCGDREEVVGEPLGRDGGILPARPRFAALLEAARQTGTVLADAPQRGAFGWVVDLPGVDDAAVGTQLLEQLVPALADLAEVVAVERDVQPGLAVRESDDGVGAPPPSHRVDDLGVDAFECRRLVAEDRHRVARGVHDVAVPQAQQDRRRRNVHEGDGRGHHDRARSLAPDQRARRRTRSRAAGSADGNRTPDAGSCPVRAGSPRDTRRSAHSARR